MSGDFLDSNIFVYLFDDTDPEKQRIAERLVQEAMQLKTGCISFQVVQETLNVYLRKFPKPANPTQANHILLTVLEPLWRVMPAPALYHRALEVQAHYGYHFYDSLIIASALQAGCRRLLSEDLQHGQQIDGLRIENPFD